VVERSGREAELSPSSSTEVDLYLDPSTCLYDINRNNFTFADGKQKTFNVYANVFSPHLCCLSLVSHGFAILLRIQQSAAPTFKSRFQYFLFWLEFVVVVLSLCKKLLGHEYFLTPTSKYLYVSFLISTFAVFCILYVFFWAIPSI